MSLKLLIVLGAAMSVYCFRLPYSTLGNINNRCENITITENIKFYECLNRTLSGSVDVDSVEMHNESACPRCQHICSQQASILECRRQFSNTIEPLNISIRASDMIAFDDKIFEEGVDFLCQNDAEILKVFRDRENYVFLLERLLHCNTFVPLYIMNPLAYCDKGGDRRSIYCRIYLNTAECIEEQVKKDRRELENFTTGLVRVIKNSNACAEHLEEFT